MEKMEHFRDGKLYFHDELFLENIDGHLGFHLKSGGRKQWFGYFELKNDQHINVGDHYDLVLADGRQAVINAADVPASEVPGQNLHVAEFYVVGDVRNARRGLRDTGRHRLA